MFMFMFIAFVALAHSHPTWVRQNKFCKHVDANPKTASFPFKIGEFTNEPGRPWMGSEKLSANPECVLTSTKTSDGKEDLELQVPSGLEVLIRVYPGNKGDEVVCYGSPTGNRAIGTIPSIRNWTSGEKTAPFTIGESLEKPAFKSTEVTVEAVCGEHGGVMHLTSKTIKN